MGKNIHVSDYQEMARVAQRLQSASETYTEIYTKLMQAASTMGSGWQGSDNQSFVAQITGFTEELKTMAAKLNQAGETLDQQRANYVNHQDDNSVQVKKLQN